MPQPVKPEVPPPALRSDPATFAIKAEDSINFWPTLTTYIDESATWIDEKSDEITAMAALAGVPDLTAFAGKIPKVNDAGDAFEFTVSGRLEAIEAGAPVTLLGPVTLSGGVTITSGQISGITDLSIADGGTGASTAAAARSNLDVYSKGEVYPRAEVYTQTAARAAFLPSGVAAGGFVVNTLYQNTTGKPLYMGMQMTTVGTSGSLRLRIGQDTAVGLSVYQTNLPNAGQQLGGFGVCPPGWWFFWEAAGASTSAGVTYY